MSWVGLELKGRVGMGVMVGVGLGVGVSVCG